MSDEINVYVAGDTGGSGFGVATKGLMKQLIPHDDFCVTLRTHEWGWNKEGHVFNSDSGFGDQRFKHFIWNNGYVNEDYLSDTSREVVDRNKDSDSLLEELKDNRSAKSKECMVRQFEGKEDVWIGIGGQIFAEYAPEDDEIHTILSTDFNLDKVPYDWKHYFEQVDEVWVPSEWTYNSVKTRFEDKHPELVEKTHWMHYGINMDYEPTAYDCVACPGNRHSAGQGQDIVNQPCLKDEKFTFLVVSRFYHIKGVYRTIKAFIKEFKGEEPVRLMFKTTSNNQFQFSPGKSIQNVVQEVGYPDPPEIGIKKELMNTQHLYDVMGQADAFVQASRAECFGIAQAEAAWCGTPVIFTNWSSQAEIMDEDNPGMIPLNEYEVEHPEKESEAFVYSGVNDYPADSHWATPDVEALGDRMREVYEMSEEERDERGQEAKQYIAENYDWNDKVEPRIERIKKGANQ